MFCRTESLVKWFTYGGEDGSAHTASQPSCSGHLVTEPLRKGHVPPKGMGAALLEVTLPSGIASWSVKGKSGHCVNHMNSCDNAHRSCCNMTGCFRMVWISFSVFQLLCLWKGVLFVAGDWTSWPLKVPSNSNHSMILWFLLPCLPAMYHLTAPCAGSAFCVVHTGLSPVHLLLCFDFVPTAVEMRSNNGILHLQGLQNVWKSCILRTEKWHHFWGHMEIYLLRERALISLRLKRESGNASSPLVGSQTFTSRAMSPGIHRWPELHRSQLPSWECWWTQSTTVRALGSTKTEQILPPTASLHIYSPYVQCTASWFALSWLRSHWVYFHQWDLCVST